MPVSNPVSNPVGNQHKGLAAGWGEGSPQTLLQLQ